MALRVPLKWLQDFTEPKTDADDLAVRLTVAGMEVEAVHRIGDWDPETVVVGHIVEVSAHPNADRLCLAKVAYGAAEPMQVVTGAPNITQYIGQPLPGEPLLAPFAMVGAELIDAHGGGGKMVKLKAGNIRGVRSEGMVCSEMELGLGENHDGIMLLPAGSPVGAPLRDVLGEAVLEFDIKGGFAHLLCVYGIARETAAILGQPLKNELLTVGRAGEHSITATPSFLHLDIADPELCPRYTAVLVEGITVQPSPFWLQQRLIHAGQRPINAVVDVTNYVMLELGQPTHAFDYDALRAEPGQDKPVIRVRRATPGEKMQTLDGVERTFDKDMLLITDGGGPVAVGGVMGGEDSEIKDNTSRVLIESANFEFLNCRRTSQLLKLRTEASERFGKRLDPDLCLSAGLRAAHLIAELCGGTVRSEYGDLYPNPVTRSPIDLELAFVERLLGVQIPEAEIRRILAALEFEVANGAAAGTLQVTPPSHRQDVTMAADLVEDIGRVYGYDRMPHTLIGDDLPPQKNNVALDGAERIRDLLSGAGLDEIITYSIVSIDDAQKLHPDRQPLDEASFLRLQNPLQSDRAHLRRGLLAEGLNTLRRNLRFGERAALFELGTVFLPVEGQVLPDQPRRLAAVMTGPRDPASWTAGDDTPKFDFFDMKGMAEALLDGLEIENATWERGEHPSFHPGRCARVSLAGKKGAELGHVGELHPRVAQHFGLPAQPVCAMEWDVEALLNAWREDRQLAAISSHPPVYEDLAFVVDATVPAEQVRGMIAQTGQPLVKAVRLFDLYRDERLGAGRKSLAFALTYQADDRTLTDTEVAKLREKIVRRLGKELSAELRA